MNLLNSTDNNVKGYGMPKECVARTLNEQQQPKGLAMQPFKPDVIDILSEKVVNKNDLNDMVTTPRAIFKGYLFFTAGTAINTIASFIKNKKVANPLTILGCLSSIFGTYNFVKPYLIKDCKLTKNEK